MVPHLVLASASPRRKELLERLGIRPEIRPADIDETVRCGERSDDYVRRLATEKALALCEPGQLVIGADTSVVLDEQILGKPTDERHAVEMLRALSGRSHHVLTGVAVAYRSSAADLSRVHHDVGSTRVDFPELSDKRIEWYLSTNQSGDKAGSYGLNGAASVFADAIEGSVTNVIGLPLPLLDSLVGRHGFDLVSFAEP